MKLLSAVALLSFVSFGLLAAGCKTPGDAFADDACACKDQACTEKVMKEHESKFPELKTKLGEMDKLPADKKAPLERGMGCVFAIAKAADKK